MSNDVLREAARRALAAMTSPGGSDGGASVAPGRVERAVFDVTVEGQLEMVTVMLRSGQLVCTTSEGRHDGPHVQAVLRLLAGPSEGGTTGTEEVAPARITVTDAGGRITFPAGATRTVDASDQPASADRSALAQALDDVVTAVVRLGVEKAEGSPSVEDTIERLAQAAPSPMPLGISRWIGRLRSALATRDVDTVARILDGAARVAEDLVVAGPTGEAMARIVSWLGATADRSGDTEPLYDRVLVEVAREWLPGIERVGLERRYLVDTASGEVLREERARGPGSAGGASVGPCPRVISVGFAEVERGARPRRIRLHQYVVSPEVSAEDWEQVVETGCRDLEPLAAEYRRALDDFPGLAEPFSLVVPAALEHEPILVPRDEAGLALPLARADDPGGTTALERVAQQGDLAWLAGRLVDAEGQLMLLACSAAVRKDGSFAIHRLR